MPARKSTTKKRTTAKRKTTTRRKPATRRKTSTRRQSPYKFYDPNCYNSDDDCRTGQARGPYTGQCNPLPCENPYMTRGPDGICRFKKCGPGGILNPETMRCVSKTSPAGRALLQYKRNDMRELRDKYNDMFAETRKLEAQLYGRDDVGDKSYRSLFTKDAYEARKQALADKMARAREINEARQKKLYEKADLARQIKLQRQVDEQKWAEFLRSQRNDFYGWQ